MKVVNRGNNFPFYEPRSVPSNVTQSSHARRVYSLQDCRSKRDKSFPLGHLADLASLFLQRAMTLSKSVTREKKTNNCFSQLNPLHFTEMFKDVLLVPEKDSFEGEMLLVQKFPKEQKEHKRN